MAPLLFVYNHLQPVTGGLVVLILVTAIFILIRSLGKKDDDAAVVGKVEATIDVDTIEGAMKRVLASQSPASAPAPVVVSGGDSEAVNAVLREREARIAELQSEIAKLRADLDSIPASTATSTAGGGPDPGDASRVNELQGKIEELKARLQEYEIIEDDIADLSLYKDENARLKHEIKRLRDEFPDSAQKVPTAESQAVDAEVAAAEAAMPKAEAAPAQEEPAPASEPAAETSPEDDVMKQFAAAVQVQKAPPPEADLKVEANPFAAVTSEASAEAAGSDSPLAFELDPEKIMNEVSSLGVSEDGGSALEESLDTDKLLAEVGSLGGAPEAPAPAAQAAPTPAAAPQPAPPAAPETKAFDPKALDVAAVDDLLAEFKETKD